jgi:uncharacterized protein YodC (DUF2158 family)
MNEFNVGDNVKLKGNKIVSPGMVISYLHPNGSEMVSCCWYCQHQHEFKHQDFNFKILEKLN